MDLDIATRPKRDRRNKGVEEWLRGYVREHLEPDKNSKPDPAKLTWLARATWTRKARIATIFAELRAGRGPVKDKASRDPDGPERPWHCADLFEPLEAVDNIYATLNSTRELKRQEETYAGPEEFGIAAFRKDPHCYLSERDIGPYLRWILILRACVRFFIIEAGGPDQIRQGKDKNARAAQVSQRWVNQMLREHVSLGLMKELGVSLQAGETDKSLKARIAKQFDLAMHFATVNQKTTESAYTKPDVWSAPLFECVREMRRRSGVGEQLKFADLFDVQVMAPDERLGEAAYRRYETWLRHGWMPVRDALSRLICDAYLMDDPSGSPSARKKQVERIVDALDAEDGIAPVPPEYALSGEAPVLNIVSPRNWSGLRALACELACAIKERQLESSSYYGIVYVPLSRALASRGELLSRADIIRILCKALNLGQGMQDGQAIGNDVADLAVIRAELSRRRALIIFDNVDVWSEPFAPLFSVLRHVDYPSFLTSLVQPDLDVLARTGRPYASRFVILSGRRISAIEAWTPGGDERDGVPSKALAGHERPASGTVPLEPPPDRQMALRLLLEQTPPDIGHLRQQAIARCLALWPTVPANFSHEGPDVGDACLLTIGQLFAIDRSRVDELRAMNAQLPNELDLAMLACAQRSGGTVHLRADENANLFSPDQRLHALRGFLYPSANFGSSVAEASVTALQFVAMAVNGLRITTLQRCLRSYARWNSRAQDAALVDALTTLAEDLADKRKLARFLDHFRPLIVQGLDEDIEGVRATRRWFEFESIHESSGAHDVAGDPQLLDVRFVDLRELFFADMLQPGFDGETDGGLLRRQRFLEIHRILAEESLEQGSAQIRALPASSGINVYAMRRFIQTVYYGLMSIQFSNSEDGTATRPPQGDIGIPGAHLPAEPVKRYVYLFEFLLRKCIEDGKKYAIGRGWGRYDVRYALFSMFLNPGWARRVLGSIYRCPDDRRSYADFGAFGNSQEFSQPFDAKAPYLSDAMGAELFQSFLHSAFRSGKYEFIAEGSERIGETLIRRRAVTDLRISAESGAGTEMDIESNAHRHMSALRALDVLLSTGRRAAERQLAIKQERFIYAKLAIDADMVTQHTDRARDSCLAWLKEFAVPRWDTLETLGQHFDPHTMGKAEFESRYLQERRLEIREVARTKQNLGPIADVLFRVGQLQANETDKDNPRDRDLAMRQYANAYALYWIGDRLRSDAAVTDLSDVEWPGVSSRAIRYYVRVSLKLAKLAAALGRSCIDNPARQRLCFDNARAWYVHARGRIDVHSRHLYRLPAERVVTHLLLASAARVEASVLSSISPDSKTPHQLLLASLEYLTDAERLLSELGYIGSLYRRLIFERVKTLRKLAAIKDEPRAAQWGRIAESQYGLLTRLSRGHPQWLVLTRQIAPSARSGVGLEPLAGGRGNRPVGARLY